jgi:soluble lytic murein transglycosylase-like protein/TolA-binding protein
VVIDRRRYPAGSAPGQEHARERRRLPAPHAPETSAIVWLCALALLLPAATAGEIPGDAEAFTRLLKQAVAHRDRGEPATALELLERIEAAWPERYAQARLDYMHGLLLARLGRDEEAVRRFERVEAADPWLAPYAWDRLSELSARLERLRDAERYLAQAMDSDFPGLRSSRGYLQRIDWLLAAGAEDASESLLGAVERRSRRTSWRQEMLLRRARLAWQEGEHRQAIHRAQKCIDLAPKSRRALIALDLVEAWEQEYPELSVGRAGRNPFHRGKALHFAGRYEEAIPYLKAYLERYPDGRVADECLYLLGRSRQRLDHQEQALQAYRRLLRGFPRSKRRVDAAVQVATIHRLAGRYDDALQALDDLVLPRKESASRARLLFHRGLVLEERSAEEALAAYRRLAALAPRSRYAVLAHWRSVWLELAAERPRRALEELTPIIARGRATDLHEEARYLRARLLQLAGRSADAREELIALCRDDPLGYFSLAAADMLLTPAHAEAVAARRNELAQELERQTTGGKVEIRALSSLLPPMLWGFELQRRVQLALEEQEPWARILYARPIPPRPPETPQTAGAPPPELSTADLFRLARELLFQGDHRAAAWVLTRIRRQGHQRDGRVLMTLMEQQLLAGKYRDCLRTARDTLGLLPEPCDLVLLPADFRRFLYPCGYPEAVQAAATAAGIDPLFLLAVIRTESAFIPDAVSPVGARGLMQIMPATGAATAREHGITDYREELLVEPEMNLRIGAAYLAGLLQRYQGDRARAAAAYNGGPHNVDRWLARLVGDTEPEFVCQIGFRETRQYVQRVLFSYYQYCRLYREML